MNRLMKVIAEGAITALCMFVAGCAYKGGKIIDGTNIEIGISIPGAEGWTINALSYTAGLRVCGNDNTKIVVSNDVYETNTYFGVVRTDRHTNMNAMIVPMEDEDATVDNEAK